MSDRTLYEREVENTYSDGYRYVEVKPCVHGNYAPHETEDDSIRYWCDGKPEADDG